LRKLPPADLTHGFVHSAQNSGDIVVLAWRIGTSFGWMSRELVGWKENRVKELERGQFHSVEEVITPAISALHEFSEVDVQQAAKKSLGQFLLESPLRDSGLRIERKED